MGNSPNKKEKNADGIHRFVLRNGRGRCFRDAWGVITPGSVSEGSHGCTGIGAREFREHQSGGGGVSGWAEVSLAAKTNSGRLCNAGEQGLSLIG